MDSKHQEKQEKLKELQRTKDVKPELVPQYVERLYRP